MRRILHSIALGACALLLVQCASPTPDERAASELAQRLIPSAASHFRFVQDTENDSTDCFSLRSEGSDIVITGNNAGSMAVGLNYYLKNYCLTEVSWYAADPVELPAELPAVEKEITADSRVADRFFLNYCTFGYTMPFWKWTDWERFIDWMALNGVNMPLAITGQEAIWYNVWTKLGLSDEEIRGYFTGPAHLPWHRMCNLDRWQGNLPVEWLKDQADLQKQIVNRERELGMRPVLPGFAGHVPAAFAARYPDAKTTEVSLWGGFPEEYRCTYLSPTDSLFNVIQKEYLTEQTRLYGTDHIYGVDPFNEVDPPTWNPDSLAEISRGIYESLADFDPEARWLQMAWFLYAEPKWTPERTKAYLQGVPQGRLVMLDYFCENVEEWKLFDKFYGQPYIWCYLGNFGGGTFITSPFATVKSRIDDVLVNGGDNLCGIGSTLEGLDVNPYIYEYVFENAWNLPEGAPLADRRTGSSDEKAREAWKLLNDSVFNQITGCCRGALVNARPTFTGHSWWTVNPNTTYANANLVRAWGMLLEAESPGRDSYRFDVVNLGRQALGNYFPIVRDRFTEAYRAGDVVAAKKAGDDLKELISDITLILRGHPAFSMRKWISDARDKGVDDAQKDYYERNARTLISIWGPEKNLNDYANRQWTELTESYYGRRWNMFVDDAIAALEAGKPFDEQAFYDKCRSFENTWIEPSEVTIDYPEPVDPVTTSKALYDKYAPAILSAPESSRPLSLTSHHHW